MFFEGALQEGIALAIQQQKLVACFIRQDDDAESKVWEQEWLKKHLESHQDAGADTTLGDLLAEKAVLLRINAGSQEAGFLSAFCPLDKIPALIIIHNGQVLENLQAGISERDFVVRISKCVGFSQVEEDSALAGGSSMEARQQEHRATSVEEVGETTTSTSVPIQTPAPSNPTSIPSETPVPVPEPSPSPAVQGLLSERAARLEAERKTREAAEREAKRAAAKARREAAEKEQASSSSDPVPQARQNWIEQQRTRQKEAKLERERILKSIESDRQARKERDQQRRLLAQSETQAQMGAAGPSQTTSARSVSASKTCSLQIRLFDGTSLRRRFQSDATLATAVRTYVAEESATDIPYSFRQILTPHPSRTIEIAEENESLQALGLTPSATLVLVPVKGYTEAYAAGGAKGMVSRGLRLGYGLVSGTVGYVGGLVGGFLGYGAVNAATNEPYVGDTADEVEPSNVQGKSMAEDRPTNAGSRGTEGGIKIRTLADQRREQEGSEFYNGNQLNFEPKKKDDDESR